jgi:hypothetical protein
MATGLRIGVLVLSAATIARTADPDPALLFQQVRDKVRENVKRVPRYTCVETVNRAEYRPRYAAVVDSCRALILERDQLTTPGYVTWHDRLRLDVAVINGRETFSWAGARQFETTDLRQLVQSGSTGTGGFASFLSTVFSLPPSQITSLGGDLFAFHVPLASSGYRYQSRRSGSDRLTGYHGSLLLDSANVELKSLTVDADEFPLDEPVCRVRDVMDYQQVKIGDDRFLLPERSTMTALFPSGQESHNDTKYANCREYKGESTIRFDDAPDTATTDAKAAALKLPSHVRLQLGLQAPIDSDNAAVGDPVTGVVMRDAKGVKAGTTVPGRIVRLEQFLLPTPRWVVAFQFEGMRPLKDTLTFAEGGKLVLDRKFRSDWETQ